VSGREANAVKEETRSKNNTILLVRRRGIFIGE
jgi:hypothetical protein